MLLKDILLGSGAAVLSGLDRTAALQLMLSRPVVAAPLTGWLLGEPSTGLQVGLLVELLWLGRLPLGAAIPPDDTQVAVGSTFLGVTMGRALGLAGLEFTLLAVLVCLPLGKVGQLFDQGARHWNRRLTLAAERALEKGDVSRAERHHLLGCWHFALASLGTFVVVVAGGALLLYFLSPLLLTPLARSASWLRLAFPLLGAAHILGTVNVNRSMSLFGASFAMTLCLLWLL